MVISTDKFFVKGTIREDQPFFIIAQTDVKLNRHRTVELNYIMLNRNGFLTLCPVTLNLHKKEVAYFTAIQKQNKIKLSSDLKNTPSKYFRISPCRDVTDQKLFAGLWYYLSDESGSHPNVYVENVILNSDIIKVGNNGAYQSVPSFQYQYARFRDIKFAFLPQSYFTGAFEANTFSNYLSWLFLDKTQKGVTQLKEIVDYPKRKGSGIIKPGSPHEPDKTPKTYLPHQKNIYTFDDFKTKPKKLKKETKKKAETTETSGWAWVIWAFICIVTAVIFYYLYQKYKNKDFSSENFISLNEFVYSK